MTINERIFNEISEKGLKQSDLALKLNLTTGQITAWKKRGTTPPAEYLIDICKFLDITIFNLLGVEEANEGASLSDDEKKIISYFRTCSEKDKKILLTICETDKDSNNDNKISSISRTG